MEILLECTFWMPPFLAFKIDRKQDQPYAAIVVDKNVLKSFYFLNCRVAIIIIPSKTVNDTHGFKNWLRECWKFVFVICILRRLLLFNTPWILLTPCFVRRTWVITNPSLWNISYITAFACSFWERSSLNFWFAGRLLAVGGMYTILLFFFKWLIYIKTFKFFQTV